MTTGVMRMATDAQRRAVRKYDAENTKQFHLKLNIKTDADIIKQLSKQENVQGYLKKVIRNDIVREIMNGVKG